MRNKELLITNCSLLIPFLNEELAILYSLYFIHYTLYFLSIKPQGAEQPYNELRGCTPCCHSPEPS